HALILFPYEINGVIHVQSYVVNLSGKSVYDRDRQVENVDLTSLKQIIDQWLITCPSIQAIGFGLPGTEYDGQMIVSDYKDLLGVSVTEYFRTRYQMPIIMENDVNAAVIGFSNRNQLAVDSSIVYLYFPDHYPPGAGIILNGKLYKGRGNFAGEVSNMPLGISWGEDYLLESTEEVCEAIAKLTVAVSCVLNPDLVILHGNFLRPDHLPCIVQKCSEQLPLNVVPQIAFSKDFAADYLTGMIIQTLNTLKPTIALTKI
ncbi:MAG: ROK family protein, partial [Gorillibacterium sp.]|nr:ROK family protein [Gorillibacterium sp.]